MSIHIQDIEFEQLKKVVDELSKKTPDLSGINNEIEALKDAIEGLGSGSSDELILNAITAENTKTKGEIDALLTAIKGECTKFKEYVDSELGDKADTVHKHAIADITDLKDATPTTHGLMSAADKEKLDGINLNLTLSVSDAQLLLSPITQLKTSDEITNESLNLHANMLNQKIGILAKALGVAN
jgi:hypothetical protein